jgi:Flp pilus assembly protein TadD/TolB-like protein
MALQPGLRLGSYEILGPLGAGGMGEVYRARDRNLGREVAIKVLPAHFANDPARSARFDREGRILATINHPAIAAVYGAEQFDGVACIIMELVPGETLSEILARGPLPLDETLEIAGQLADALEAAHERGVVHRDLKPSNIKVTPEGKVKVLDLGLAKVVEPVTTPEAELYSDTPTRTLDKTRPGDVLGTVEFMSPEQARGKPLDKRTDIWSFGCILFEMLSGGRAFTGESQADVFASILTRDPDWPALPPATPPRLRELLSRCLQKDPRQRLRDLGDARLEIDRLRRKTGAITGASKLPAARPGPRAGPLLAAAAVLLAGIAGFLVWRSFRTGGARPAPPSPTVGQLAVLPFRNLTGDESAQLMGVGLVETVSVRLSGLPGLQVVTPSAVVSAVDRRKESVSAAREVGASLMVDGTFQRQGEVVRVTYRLVDVGTGAQIAASSLDGSASDLFALQDNLADGVAKDLHFAGIRRRQTVAPKLDADQQARYLQAVGLLQRYDRRDAVEQALAILGKLAADRPDAAPVQAALGRANLRLFPFTKDRGLAERAIASADAARTLDPTLPEVDLTVGETLAATGRAAEAVQAFRRALAANADDFDALLGLGGALEKTGDDAGAESTLKRAIALQPSFFAGYNHLGAFYFHRGRYRDAARMFGEAARMTPDSYRALNNLGGASTMACDFSAASDAYRKALALQPQNAGAASNLGLNLLWTGRYAEATKTLESAVKLSPGDFRIWGNLGDAYRGEGNAAKAQEAYARALSLARDSLRLNPKDTQAHQAVASALAKTGHPAEAQEPIRRALALDPRDPDVLANAATVAALSLQTAEAIEWLRKAVEAGYCPDIVQKQPEFAGLQDDPRFRSIIAAPRKAAGS